MLLMTRVDHRLLHGQVSIAWTSHLGIDCILIANDDVAQNDFRKSVLRLAKPLECKIVFNSIEDSAKAINDGKTDKFKLLIIVETVHDARRLCEMCDIIKEVNIGLSQKKKDSKAIGKAVYLDKSEIDDIKALDRKGIKLFLQQAPKNFEVSINTMLNKGEL